MSELTAFLAHFDSYAALRDELRASDEGSDEERSAIIRCADQWRVLCDAREGVKP